MPEMTITAAKGAFGDGRHPSTQGALRLMAGLQEYQPMRVLDVGCGSGILTLAACQLWPEAHVVATDNRVESVSLTRQNVQAANCQTRAQAWRADGVQCAAVQAMPPFPLVVSNILAEPLITMASDLCRMTAPQGWLILSGILMWREPLVLEAYRLNGMTCAESLSIGEWRSLLLHHAA